MPKLSVHLVTWNGLRYLPHLFASLRAQTFRDWDLLVIDNGSTDGTPDALAQELATFPVPTEYIRHAQNMGFAAGYNAAMRRTNGPLVQLCNQDIVLAPEYFARLVELFDRAPDAAAAQGVLLRWGFDGSVADGGTRTSVIDSTGLRVFRSRRVVDACAGVEWTEDGMIVDAPVEMFGVSGALPMYRRAALHDVCGGTRERSEYFDESYGSYKEDVDLAFRLRSRRWRSYLVPSARAWHDRTAVGASEHSDAAAIALRAGKSETIRFHSYRNHLACLLTNEHPRNFMRDWPWIAWYECKKFVYCAWYERATLRAISDLWRTRAMIRAKRRAIMARWRVPPEEVRRWFG